MASPNMASSSMPYNSGNMVVVTHVLPAAPGGEHQPSLDKKHKFRRGEPKVLGTIQIMIGALTLLFGIAAAAHHPSLGVYSGIFVWGSLFYIASGSLTVVAEKYLSRCLINTAMAFNIIAAIFAVTGVVLYALDPFVWFPYDFYDNYRPHNYGGYSAVVAVFQFLELVVSITVAVCACAATCSCCTEEPQVVLRTVEGAVNTQAQPPFQPAPVAPAQPYPQVAPNFKNPGDLGFAEPPAYQPN